MKPDSRKYKEIIGGSDGHSIFMRVPRRVQNLLVKVDIIGAKITSSGFARHSTFRGAQSSRTESTLIRLQSNIIFTLKVVYMEVVIIRASQH